MDLSGNSSGEGVSCECGGKLVLAPSPPNTVICTACKRTVTSPQLAARLGGGPAQAAPAEETENEFTEHMRGAAALVNNGKFIEALAIYRGVRDAQHDHRDAIYGMGFCYYKLADLKRAKWLLEQAHELAHPSAMKLLLKIQAKLDAAAAAGTPNN